MILAFVPRFLKICDALLTKVSGKKLSRIFLCLEMCLKGVSTFIIEITIYFKIKLFDPLIIYTTFLSVQCIIKEMLFSGLYIT